MFTAIPNTLPTNWRIMPIVAALTEGSEIEQRRRFRPMIVDVRDRQHHATPGDGMGFIILRSTPFAAIPGPILSHKPASQLPILRIPESLFRTNRHVTPTPAGGSAYGHFGSATFAVVVVLLGLERPDRPVLWQQGIHDGFAQVIHIWSARMRLPL